ncbi:class A beta-lactamase-related serine hydrolase [Nocardioides immobilis]|uniref:Class A beta-lactamase-related serine hydrolase n=1 Tax=Nocardioides immobilis TaxID=2049295 RepID=A0A417XWA5_9ACTN|nr:class A beta-lactamase-related serine hydrolase [Nocardioides immobilis]
MNRSWCRRPVLSLALMFVLALAGCSSESPAGPATKPASPSATETQATPPPAPEPFPVRAFADINADPVSEDRAAELQAVLEEMSEDADGAGMSATVLSPEGSWSGAIGTADASGRKVGVRDQFAIASVTKTIVATQVMQLVEAGELGLDDPAADYLPADLDFDSNGATIRHLLSHYSGIPDWFDDEFKEKLATRPGRSWRLAEVLATIEEDRWPAGETFEYADTNYNLLGLIIEQVTGRPLVDVLRDGVLGIDRIPRLIYQPDEAPSEPIAMPYAEPVSALEARGGTLPSLADSTSAGPAGALATDASSLAHWWQALCTGQLVSPESLTAMARDVETGERIDRYGDGHGLGLTNMTGSDARSFGYGGYNLGYLAWTACLPASGSVVVVLTNTTEVPEAWPRPLVAEVDCGEAGATP